MEHGWATKYLWLGIVESIYKGFNFIEHIKNSNMTFTVKSGTTEADCHGSTTALEFYSKRVVDILKQCTKDKIKEYKIKTNFKTNQDFFYLDIKSTIPRIQNEDIFTEPDLKTYCEENITKLNDLIIIGSEISPCYSDFSRWDGCPVFTMKGSEFYFVTEEVKKILEEIKIKNIRFVEVKFCKNNA